MENRCSQFDNEDRQRNHRRGPQPIGVVLAELWPNIRSVFPKYILPWWRRPQWRFELSPSQGEQSCLF